MGALTVSLSFPLTARIVTHWSIGIVKVITEAIRRQLADKRAASRQNAIDINLLSIEIPTMARRIICQLAGKKANTARNFLKWPNQSWMHCLENACADKLQMASIRNRHGKSN